VVSFTLRPFYLAEGKSCSGLRTGLDFVKKKFSVGFEALTAAVMYYILRHIAV
jgi:hypothetical protein